MTALHVVSFPHTATDGTYATCAYTERVRKFCKMMSGRQRDVILYGSESNTAPCDEHVVCVTEERRTELFGEHDEADLNRGGFDWSPKSVWWRELNARAAGEILARAEPGDIICLSQGQAQALIADVNPALPVAEIMVGYEGIFNVGDHARIGAHAACAFESRTHQHLVYGRWGLQNRMNERWYDTVIPNQFDPDDFPPLDRAARRRVQRRGEYLLFVGRLIANKGPHIAAQIADALDMKLVVAGPGALEVGDGYIRAEEVLIQCRDLEFAGPVGIRERNELMAGAVALLAPTIYVEPFGGVAVEAMMVGTPVVATPFGAFTETVQPGLSGYLFHTLQQGCDAVQKALELDRDAIRAYAHGNYSLEAVAPRYDAWFDRIDGLRDGGWGSLSPTGASSTMVRT